ncbi:unnamed protein product [Closterium sp. NIES-53]
MVLFALTMLFPFPSPPPRALRLPPPPARRAHLALRGGQQRLPHARALFPFPFPSPSPPLASPSRMPQRHCLPVGRVMRGGHVVSLPPLPSPSSALSRPPLPPSPLPQPYAPVTSSARQVHHAWWAASASPSASARFANDPGVAPAVLRASPPNTSACVNIPFAFQGGHVGSLRIMWNVDDGAPDHLVCGKVVFWAYGDCVGSSQVVEIPGKWTAAKPDNFKYATTSYNDSACVVDCIDRDSACVVDCIDRDSRVCC